MRSAIGCMFESSLLMRPFCFSYRRRCTRQLSCWCGISISQMSAGKATQLKKLLDQVLDRPNRGEVLLDLLLTNIEEIIEEVKIGGSLGCSDCALVEFTVYRNMVLA